MALTSITVKDGAGSNQTMAVKDTGSSVYAAAHHPVIGTTEVSSTNPIPVMLRQGIRLLPTMGTQTSGAYSANDVVDTKLILAGAHPVSGGSGILRDVQVISKSTQTGTYDVFVFEDNPSNTSLADNAAWALNAADLTKLVGCFHCNDVSPLGTGSLHKAAGQWFPFKLAATSLYAFVVCRFALTQSSTSDMILSAFAVPD